MNSDDHGRNSHNFSSRKSIPGKTHGYSPSSNYNYGNTNAHGTNHGNHGNTSGGNKPHHRKPGGAPFKRDGHGQNDKIIKQNDLIISLLKEIRDRLPEPQNVKKEIITPEIVDEIETSMQATDETADEVGADDGECVPEVEDEQSFGNAGGDYESPDDDDLDSKVNGNI